MPTPPEAGLDITDWPTQPDYPLKGRPDGGSPFNSRPSGVIGISGTPIEGETLSISNTLADAEGLGAFSYQWKRDGVNISGATSSTYLLVTADVGTIITVTVSYTDGSSQAESKTSAGTVAVIEFGGGEPPPASDPAVIDSLPHVVPMVTGTDYPLRIGDPTTTDSGEDGDPGTHTFVAAGAFDGTGAAKFTPPEGEGNVGIGSVVAGASFSTDVMSMRWCMYMTDYFCQNCNPNKIVIHRMADAVTRPMIIAGTNAGCTGGQHHLPAACNGTSCRWNSTVDYWPVCDNDNLKMGPNGISEEWVTFESRIIGTTHYLYAWTRDGSVAGLQAQYEIGGPQDWSSLDILGGYIGNGAYNPRGSNNWLNADNYFMLSHVQFNDGAIGPPAGFLL